MRDLGFLLKPSPFNSMISLYGRFNKKDMVKKLEHEVIENNVDIESVMENLWTFKNRKRAVYRVCDKFIRGRRRHVQVRRHVRRKLT
ncbi:unnamed protein product [Arabidopsis halleri]